MINGTGQTYCAGTTQSVNITFGRTHYTVTFPWGGRVKVGKNYGRNTPIGPVLGDNARVMSEAARFIEGQPKKALAPVLRYALREGASIGEMTWACQKLGLFAGNPRHDRAPHGVISVARMQIA